jgi:ankyrin repeat protein
MTAMSPPSSSPVIPLTDAEWTALEGLGWEGARTVEAKDDFGLTPLIKVCGDFHAFADPARALVLIERLLEAGADPNAPDNGGYPVTWHCPFREFDILLPLLVKWGANLNQPVGMEGNALIHMYADPISLVSARILLELGADPRQPNDNGKSALDFSREHQTTSDTDSLERLVAETTASHLQRSLPQGQPPKPRRTL